MATDTLETDKNVTTGCTERALAMLDAVSDVTRHDIRAHAAEDYPKECCGFIASKGKHQKAFRSRNDSEEPTKRFRTNAEDWQKVEDDGWDVIAIYHSHCDAPPVPSDGDKTEAEKHKLPFVIMGWPADVWDFYAPTGWQAELLGRPFIHGILDCYTLAKDYYQKECGITLPEFERPDDWWMKGGNLYMEQFGQAGFVQVEDLRQHDILLIQMKRSPVVNHCAIYEGNGMIIHHMQDRISLREPYVFGAGYARQVHAIVRHKALL